MARSRKKTGSPPAPVDADSLTGEQFAAVRAVFGLSQKAMAEELGVALRTVIRMEAQSARSRYILLSHAKLVRCLARERKIDISKALRPR